MENNINKRYKSFTSLEQSKILAEFLPLESADMYYFGIDDYPNSSKQYHEILIGKIDKDDVDEFGHIPCWSLAALLNVLPKKLHTVLAIGEQEKYAIGSTDTNKYDCIADNPVDACVEMILKLHEQKLL